MVLALTLGLPASAPPQARDDAREIMRRVLRESRADDETVDVAMDLVDGSGRTRRRTATFYMKKRTAENSVRLIRFHTPPEFARSGILTVERSDGDTDQWIYLPAYHASRRVPSANRGDTWMGTDFTYEDITDPKIELYEYRTVGAGRVDGTACTLIEAVPTGRKLAEESAYSRTVSCVEVEQAVALRVEFFDRGGRRAKVLSHSGLRRLGKYRRWDAAEMVDLVRTHTTRLVFSNRKVDRGLTDEYFDARYLERGR
jgi:uncharacterized protein